MRQESNDCGLAGKQTRTNRHNKHTDTTNNITHHLARTTDGEWIHASTWMSSEGPVEDVHQRGENLELNPVDIDATRAADYLRRNNNDDHLTENADVLGEALIEEWRDAAVEHVRYAIGEGLAGVTEETVWCENEFGFSQEVERVMDEHGIESDHAYDALYRALDVAVKPRRNSWEKPHMEHEAVVTLE